jgi:hypothetical protein
MNERIKELADKAELYAAWMTPQGLECFGNFKEQFALLLVRECANIVSGTAVDTPPNDLLYGYNLGVNKAAENLLKHFGVNNE